MPVHGVPAPQPRFEPQGHRSERPSPYGEVDAILLVPGSSLLCVPDRLVSKPISLDLALLPGEPRGVQRSIRGFSSSWVGLLLQRVADR